MKKIILTVLLSICLIFAVGLSVVKTTNDTESASIHATPSPFVASPSGLLSPSNTLSPNIYGDKKSKPLPTPSETHSMVDIINYERRINGVDPVKENAKLTKSATNKACDMRDRNYWAHVAPDGTTAWSFFIGVGYSYHYAGENLVRDVSDDTKAMKLLMTSPKHKENVLDSSFEDVGIGYCGSFIVQHFGKLD